MKVTILGCGSATGTPAVGRGWGYLDSKNPKNSRLRSSILVENVDTCILVDTSPDLRQQLLNADVERLDAVLYTHYHADHLHGIDDLRQINRSMNAAIDMYADADTMDNIKQRFGYVLEPIAAHARSYFKPTLNPHTLNNRDRLTIGDVDIDVFVQDHGYCKTLGFRFGPIAYSTDVVEMPENAFEILSGVDTWIIGALIDQPHPTHAHVDKALKWMERVGPRRGILTHMGFSLDYEVLKNRLPDYVEPAFDGMIIEA
jgi:phosphoribosyl 1,2-cyclic phosphate phosphodiesterase